MDGAEGEQPHFTISTKLRSRLVDLHHLPLSYARVVDEASYFLVESTKLLASSI